LQPSGFCYDGPVAPKARLAGNREGSMVQACRQDAASRSEKYPWQYWQDCWRQRSCSRRSVTGSTGSGSLRRCRPCPSRCRARWTKGARAVWTLPKIRTSWKAACVSSSSRMSSCWPGTSWPARPVSRRTTSRMRPWVWTRSCTARFCSSKTAVRILPRGGLRFQPTGSRRMDFAWSVAAILNRSLSKMTCEPNWPWPDCWPRAFRYGRTRIATGSWPACPTHCCPDSRTRHRPIP